MMFFQKSEPERPDWGRFGIFVLCGLLLLLFAYGIFTFFPLERYSGFYPPCPLHKCTGLYCPGCGSTRMISGILHFDFYSAFRKNPLSFVALPFLAYAILVETAAFCRIRIPSYRPGSRMIYGIFAVIILYWIFRNIPLYPFTLLAPS